MTKEVTMYTIICDVCGKDACEGTEYAGWSDVDIVIEMAVDEGWIDVPGKHYCPDCYSYNNNGKLVVKTKTK